MKKRKILYLIPFAALVLSGCTFQEGWQTTTGWLSKNVWTPVVNFFEGLFGKKDEKKEEEGDDPKPTPTPTPTPAETDHAGTEEDPYSGKDAVAVANSLNEGASTSDYFYIKGEVKSIEETFNADYGNYSFKIDDGFICWRLKYSAEYVKFNENDIAVGDEVTVYAQIQNYSGKPETKGGYVTKVKKAGPDAELLSIEIAGEPQTEYLEGSSYNHNGLSVIAHYEGVEDVDVTQGADWSFSKPTATLGDESITITARYEDKVDTLDVTVTVIDSSNPTHAGTEADPYTGADAYIVGSKLPQGSATEESFYIRGVVQKFEETFDPSFGSYSFAIENSFIVWRVKNGENKAPFVAGDIEVGDTVTVKSPIQNYGGKPETTNAGYVVDVAKPQKEIASITSVTGIPESINQNDSLDLSKIYGSVVFTDSTTGTRHPDSVELITSTVADNVNGVLHFGSQTYNFTINVVAVDLSVVELTADSLGLGSYADGSKDNIAWSQLMKGQNSIQGNKSRNPSSELHNTSAFAGEIESIEFTITYAAGTASTAEVTFGSAVSPTTNAVALGSGTSYSLSTAGTFTVTAPAGCDFFKLSWTNGASYYGSIKIHLKQSVPVVPVSSITLNEDHLSLEVGQETGLNPTVLPEDATDPTVSWATTNESVATVDETGLIAAVGPGQATIIATAGEESAECIITVTQPVIGVEIDETISVIVGGTNNLTVTVSPSNASNTNYTFSVDDETVATVDADGTVHGLAAGETTITVTTEDGGFEDVCTVTVQAQEIPVSSVEAVSESAHEVHVGDVVALEISVLPENATVSKAVEWTVESGTAVSVNENGSVTALELGEAVVRATSVSNPSAYAEFTFNVVATPVSGITVNPEELALEVGQTGNVSAVVAPASATNPAFEWSSDDENVATVDEDGLVTAVGAGEAVITATTDDGSFTDTCAVTVTEHQAVPGTEELPYTVEEAIYAIDNGGTVANVYASGFVSSIVTAYSSTNHNVSFNISSDGLTNSPQLQGFRTVGTTAYPIDSADSVQVGDKVTLYGSLTKYNNTTYEFEAGNTLVYQERKTQDPVAVRITSGNEVAVNSNLELVAQVGPTTAPQDVTWSIVEGASLASLNGNVLTAGSTTGEVRVRATADGFDGVYAEQVISVVASTKAYRIVTDPTALADGDSIIIASEDSTYGMGAYTGGNNVPAKALGASDGVVNSLGDVVALTIEDAGSGKFYIKIGEQYLYAASSSGNQLKAKGTKDSTNGVWEFSYSDGKMTIIASGSSNRNNMRFNGSNNPPIFSCYAATSGVSALMQVYKLS